MCLQLVRTVKFGSIAKLVFSLFYIRVENSVINHGPIFCSAGVKKKTNLCWFTLCWNWSWFEEKQSCLSTILIDVTGKESLQKVWNLVKHIMGKKINLDYSSIVNNYLTMLIFRLKLFLEQFAIRGCVLNSELPVNSR